MCRVLPLPNKSLPRLKGQSQLVVWPHLKFNMAKMSLSYFFQPSSPWKTNFVTYICGSVLISSPLPYTQTINLRSTSKQLSHFYLLCFQWPLPYFGSPESLFWIIAIFCWSSCFQSLPFLIHPLSSLGVISLNYK